MANPPPSSKLRWTTFAVLALFALAVRLPQLANRPMHTDEAVNAYITGNLLAGEPFQYDPRDRHGPALYLFAEPLARLCGSKTFSELTETQLRLTPVIIGSVTVLLFGAGVELFGFIACFTAALLFSIAPLPVYYSRDFIHETLIVAATFGLILSTGRLLAPASPGRSPVFAMLAGICAALMLATKETSIIHYFALGAAALSCWPFNRSIKSRVTGDSTTSTLWRSMTEGEHTLRSLRSALMVGTSVFIVTIIVLFPGFSHTWHALADLFRAISHYAHRAAGEGHQKPFWYYAILLGGGWSGLPMLAMALVGFIVTFVDSWRRKAASPMLFVALYCVFVVGIYSTIPYKTPWLALNFWLPLSLLIGSAVSAILERFAFFSFRWLLIIPTALIVTAVASDTINRVFRIPADETNPYAYSQTVESLLDLPPRLEQLAGAKHLASQSIAVVAADPWPLPWYLRRFPRVGYWQPGAHPSAADLFITSPEAADQLEDKLNHFRPEFFGLRPEVVIILWTPQQ